MPLTIGETTDRFLTLEQVLREANVPLDSDAATLAELELNRETAQETVEGICGPVLWQPLTETVPIQVGPTAYLNGAFVELTTKPIVSVTTAVLSGSTAVVTYTLDGPAGQLTNIKPWTWSYGRNLTVSYIAGRTSCPASLVKAAAIIAANMWGTQLGNSPATGGVFEAEEPRLETQELAGYLIPNRAAELLTPYALSTVLVY